jgi:biopolymer transport protein ExbB
MGREDEARAQVAEALKKNPNASIHQVRVSEPYRDEDEMERYLDTLGTVAAISPLLGLLGTVIGMVKVFTAITTHGVGNPTVLAGGIAEALITTAAGLTVAIPALIGFRYFRNRIDTLVVDMEKEAIKLVEALHRRQEFLGKDS